MFYQLGVLTNFVNRFVAHYWAYEMCWKKYGIPGNCWTS